MSCRLAVNETLLCAVDNPCQSQPLPSVFLLCFFLCTDVNNGFAAPNNATYAVYSDNLNVSLSMSEKVCTV